MDRGEIKEVLDKLDHMQGDVQELSDAVFGDTKGVADGLIKDMRSVREFIVKWDKREFAIKWLAALVCSNIFLTLLGFLFTLMFGGA